MNKYDATLKVKKRLFEKTKDEVSKEIGISRPTLDARLSFNNWKISEIYLIKNL